MATTTPRALHDRCTAINRQIRALSRNPAEWDPDDLQYLADLEVSIEMARTNIVIGLREHGSTDKQIGEALGVTQQAVSKRWPGGGRYVGAAGRYRSPRVSDHAEP